MTAPFKPGYDRVDFGLMRTPSGRVREMTAREIDLWSDHMVEFGERVLGHHNRLPPELQLFRHIAAICLAEDEDEEAER